MSTPATTPALVIHAAKDLRLEEVPVEATGDQQVRLRIERGGVCGSDLHYYHDGGFGPVRLKQPMVLGHEVCGRIEELGSAVTGLEIGERVSVSPSRPCGRCRYCREGLPNHCENMRFYGSAMPYPHIQGAFRRDLVVDASQCVPMGDLSPAEGACAEPLAVALHGVQRAGPMLGRRVLVTGSGPIGVLAAMAARRAGAAEIVCTDLVDAPLQHARAAGVDDTVNISAEPERMAAFGEGKGTFDVLLEASGAESAVVLGIGALRPRGVLVQLGIGGDMRLPMIQLTGKELDLRGSFRFHETFPLAVELMRKRLVDVAPLITHTYDLQDAEAAFLIASDRRQAMKAQIRFEDD